MSDQSKEDPPQAGDPNEAAEETAKPEQDAPLFAALSSSAQAWMRDAFSWPSDEGPTDAMGRRLLPISKAFAWLLVLLPPLFTLVTLFASVATLAILLPLLSVVLGGALGIGCFLIGAFIARVFGFEDTVERPTWLSLILGAGGAINGVIIGAELSSAASSFIFSTIPALVFFGLLLIYFLSRLTEQLGFRVAYTLEKSPLGQLHIGLTMFLIYALVLTGPGFFFCARFFYLNFGVFATLQSDVLRQWNEAWDGLATHFSSLMQALGAIATAEWNTALALMVALLWTASVFIFLNWLVTKNFLKTIYIFVTAFFLNLLTLMLLFLMQAVSPSLALALAEAVNFLDQSLRCLFLAPLSGIAAAFQAPEELVLKVEAAGVALFKVFSALIELSARMSMISGGALSELKRFLAFKEQFDLSYFLFLAVSGVVWYQGGHNPLRAIPQAFQAFRKLPAPISCWVQPSDRQKAHARWLVRNRKKKNRSKRKRRR